MDSKMLSKLDELEDHPGLYTRTPVTCVLEQSLTRDTEVISCETYILHNFKKAMLSEPFLRDYNMEVYKATKFSPTGGKASDYDIYQEVKD